MRYEQEPRPEIENHYHIKDLIEAQNKKAIDRSDYRERERVRQEREDLIKDSEVVVMKEFYCEQCAVDFVNLAVKQIEVDWTNSAQRIAFYKSKHRACGRWAMRYITDRNRDPYWFKSKKVRRDQGVHYNDALQPFQTGYQLVYGKK